MSWTEIGSVASESSKHTRYAIAVNAEGDLSCKCMSWTHSKEVPKVCRHVQSNEAGRLLHEYQTRLKPITVPFRLTNIGQRTYIGLGQYGIIVPASRAEEVENLVVRAHRLLEVPSNIFARANLRAALRKLGVLA